MNASSTSTVRPVASAAADGADPAPRVVVPADIDTPDRIAWGLSFRQLATLAAGALPLWFAYARFGPVLPGLAWVGIAVVTAGVTVTVALGRRDGLPLDVWVRHGLTMASQPQLQAPGTPASGKSLVVTTPGRPPVSAPLRVPAIGITADGTVTVDGAARAVLACGTTSITLRTAVEQAGLVEGFGQWLNALSGPTQLLVSTARHDLTAHIDAVTDAAQRLPDSPLRAAALDHAAFLAELDATREPLHRQVLAVVPAGHPVETTTRALTGLGITTIGLDGPAVTAALSAAADPYAPPVHGTRAVPGIPITAGRTS
jgi:hypothetical protein